METSSLSQVSASFTSLPDLTSTSEEYAADTLAMASKFDYTDFEGWLCAGGDDRSLILDSGANKYHIKPQPIQDSHIFRGSCTGNPPTSGGYDAARALYEEKLFGVRGAELDSVLRDIFQHQRERLATYLNLPSGTEIILCPSGSDAEYIPIAIARSLHPDKGIINGITQLNEIGAGSAPASTGLFFSKYAPFLGDHGLNRLDGFEDIDGVVISAREKDGGVVNASDKMEEFCVTSLKSNMYPIVHGVFGGKTGLRDDVMPGSMEKGDVSMGVVDACQGRFSIAELHQWLEQDSIVLFTTSKFYQAPPFCGAVIVPASIAAKLSKSSPPVGMLVDNGLGGFLTDKELPPCLEKWKAHLKDEGKNNVGLALRWEAGLFAMESISAIPDEERITMTDEWANEIQNMVDTHVMLETFCVERSIVSIRIAKKDGGWLNMSEARDLFRFMSLDVSGAVPHASDDEKEALSTPAFIGQPVSVSESFAIVRIALGVDSLLSYAKDKTQTLKEDELLIRKLDAIAKYFDALQGSDL